MIYKSRIYKMHNRVQLLRRNTFYTYTLRNRGTSLHPNNVTYQHPLGRNLAPQKQVCTHKVAISLVCTRIYVHPSECKPAPFIFAPLRVQKCLYDCKHEYLGFKCAPLSVMVQACSQRCSQCDNLGCKLEPLLIF